MPTIRRLAYSAVSMVSAAATGRRGAPASTTLNVGSDERPCRRRAATRSSRGCRRANAPTWSSWARSGPRAARGHHLEVEAPVRRALDEDRAGQRRRRARPRPSASAFDRASNTNVRSGSPAVPSSCALRNSSITLTACRPSAGSRGHDADPRDGRPVQQPDAQRDQRDHHREAGQQQGREHEGARPDALAVLAAGDEPDVGRVAALGPSPSQSSGGIGCGAIVTPRPRSWCRRPASAPPAGRSPPPAPSTARGASPRRPGGRRSR